MASGDAPPQLVVLNPQSGRADHADRVRELAASHGLAVRETERAGEAAAVAAHAAANGTGFVAAAGGDGTLNEVALGLAHSGALAAVTFAAVPCGTGNGFAGNLGVTDVEHAFELIELGERRPIDVGVAEAADGGNRPFLNSCVGGITAEASARTDSASKERFGTVAYAIATAGALTEFEGLHLEVEPVGGGERWSGDAALVFVGNARGVPDGGRGQANVEDGAFDVAIVEDRPTTELVGDAAAQQLFDGNAGSVTRMLAPELTVSVSGEERPFSLDGEMIETDSLRFTTRERTLETVVGQAYESDPDTPV